jgi:hypothetical protein
MVNWFEYELAGKRYSKIGSDRPDALVCVKDAGQPDMLERQKSQRVLTTVLWRHGILTRFID